MRDDSFGRRLRKKFKEQESGVQRERERDSKRMAGSVMSVREDGERVRIKMGYGVLHILV